MTDNSASNTRLPLAEATNRINAFVHADSQGRKPRPEVTYASTNTNTSRSVQGGPPSTSTQYGARAVSNNSSAMHRPSTAGRGPDQTEEEAKRLSRASYESTSSSSKKTYKTHIGPWQLGRTLGKGSSARVRLCRHSLTDQLAAVKIVNRRMAYLVQDSSLAALSDWDSSMPNPTPGEMRVPMAIEREVAILKLIEHPHIMRIYDIWENRYLILEYIDQGDLFTFINSRGRLGEEVTMYFFRQMISAITYCHSFNICHRDLKPENILITSDYKIKIADFGMAALHQTDTHRLSTACGSPHYAAPELLKNRQYRGDKADIWSLGVILYAMLAATLPFDDPDLRVMMGKTKKGQYEMPKNISPEAEDLIRRMLQVNPERRISLSDIWRHPLVQKYQYLDSYGENNGQPPDIRKGFQNSAVPRAEIDTQLLRQLRSMWHMFSENDLILKLTCEEPNDQKAFYWLLSNYREQQLEDFKPEVSHSTSDYHHLKPGVWKKRVSTCEFSQPRANGHGRSISRFTVISTTAETDTDTVQSYDPYRGSRVFQPLNSQVSHAKITVHRDRPEYSSQRSNQQARARSGSASRTNRPSSARGTMTSHAPSSRGSLVSLQSSTRQGASHARKSGLRHRRGVEFNHAQKRPQSAKGSHTKGSQTTVTIDQSKQEARKPRLDNRSMSPELPVNADGMFPKAKGAPVPTSKTKSGETVFTEEELRHFSSNIAKDCDNAFRSSLIEEESIAGSLGESERKQRDSHFMFSLDSTPNMTPATEMSMKTWDSRPLLPLPSDMAVHSQIMASPRMTSSSVITMVDAEGAEKPTEGVAQSTVPIIFSQYDDRRFASAPAQTQTHCMKRVDTMPAINENTEISVATNDKSRIVSAPPHAPHQRIGGHAQGMEYLSKVENSIRVVHSPNAIGPVKIPAPLRVRKNPTRGEASRRSSQQPSSDGGESREDYLSQDGGIMTKKPKTWFRRASRAESEENALSFRDSRNQLMSKSQASCEDIDGNPTGIAAKKKSFSFPFWKTSKSSELKMSIGGRFGQSSSHTSDGLSSTVTTDGVKEKGDAPRSEETEKGESKRHSDASSHRIIEVKQNWLARLFRVKPATSYLCLTISRRRARQEVAILLREWRKYGIRGIQVDKQRNIVFARVGAENYLNLKEVDFAAEMVTVIEHGNRQPLSIIRFTQERGAASSFHQVVGTMKVIFESRNLLVADRSKVKMMIKTLTHEG